MYGHSIKTKAKRNNVSCQKQGQQNRDIISQRTLENRILFYQNTKPQFLLILAFGTGAKKIVEYQKHEKIIGKVKLSETDKGTKKLINIIKNRVGNCLGFGNTKLKIRQTNKLKK